jgi:aryl-alcohol dehydrogenase-like predicted oxidoreductase
METQIALRNLGKSSLQITPIGLGCWQFSKAGNLAGKFWPSLEDDLIKEIVKASLDGGINWFDTAELYGNGASEKMLSRSLTALGKNPGEVIVATKWNPIFRFASNIGKTIDIRLACLNPFPIDLYQVHMPYSFSSVVREMEEMAKLVEAKKIKYVGREQLFSQADAHRLGDASKARDQPGIQPGAIQSA